MIREAVSIRQPYGFAICYLGKGVENRGRDDGRVPVLAFFRGPILLHSSAWFGMEEVREQARDCFDVARENGLDLGHLGAVSLRRLKAGTGGIIGRCRVVGAVADVPPRGLAPSIDRPHARQQVGSVLDLPEDQRRWFVGPYGAVLAAVEAFEELIPCKGSLGIFRVPEAVAEAAAGARVVPVPPGVVSVTGQVYRPGPTETGGRA